MFDLILSSFIIAVVIGGVTWLVVWIFDKTKERRK